jgi:hypothetical protein
MNPAWPMLVAPPLAAVTAAILCRRSRLAYWFSCSLLTAAIAGAFYYFARANPGPPFNAPSLLAAVFVVIPAVATFGIERVWFTLGQAVSRPWTTAALSLPLGFVTYAFGLFVAVLLGVNVGVLWP